MVFVVLAMLAVLLPLVSGGTIVCNIVPSTQTANDRVKMYLAPRWHDGEDDNIRGRVRFSTSVYIPEENIQCLAVPLSVTLKACESETRYSGAQEHSLFRDRAMFAQVHGCPSATVAPVLAQLGQGNKNEFLFSGSRKISPMGVLRVRPISIASHVDAMYVVAIISAPMEGCVVTLGPARAGSSTALYVDEHGRCVDDHIPMKQDTASPTVTVQQTDSADSSFRIRFGSSMWVRILSISTHDIPIQVVQGGVTVACLSVNKMEWRVFSEQDSIPLNGNDRMLCYAMYDSSIHQYSNGLQLRIGSGNPVDSKTFLDATHCLRITGNDVKHVSVGVLWSMYDTHLYYTSVCPPFRNDGVDSSFKINTPDEFYHPNSGNPLDSTFAYESYSDGNGGDSVDVVRFDGDKLKNACGNRIYMYSSVRLVFLGCKGGYFGYTYIDSDYMVTPFMFSDLVVFPTIKHRVKTCVTQIYDNAQCPLDGVDHYLDIYDKNYVIYDLDMCHVSYVTITHGAIGVFQAMHTYDINPVCLKTPPVGTDAYFYLAISLGRVLGDDEHVDVYTLPTGNDVDADPGFVRIKKSDGLYSEIYICEYGVEDTPFLPGMVRLFFTIKGSLVYDLFIFTKGTKGTSVSVSADDTSDAVPVEGCLIRYIKPDGDPTTMYSDNIKYSILEDIGVHLVQDLSYVYVYRFFDVTIDRVDVSVASDSNTEIGIDKRLLMRTMGIMRFKAKNIDDNDDTNPRIRHMVVDNPEGKPIVMHSCLYHSDPESALSKCHHESNHMSSTIVDTSTFSLCRDSADAGTVPHVIKIAATEDDAQSKMLSVKVRHRDGSNLHSRYVRVELETDSSVMQPSRGTIIFRRDAPPPDELLFMLYGNGEQDLLLTASGADFEVDLVMSVVGIANGPGSLKTNIIEPLTDGCIALNIDDTHNLYTIPTSVGFICMEFPAHGQYHYVGSPGCDWAIHKPPVPTVKKVGKSLGHAVKGIVMKKGGYAALDGPAHYTDCSIYPTFLDPEEYSKTFKKMVDEELDGFDNFFVKKYKVPDIDPRKKTELKFFPKPSRNIDSTCSLLVTKLDTCKMDGAVGAQIANAYQAMLMTEMCLPETIQTISDVGRTTLHFPKNKVRCYILPNRGVGSSFTIRHSGGDVLGYWRPFVNVMKYGITSTLELSEIETVVYRGDISMFNPSTIKTLDAPDKENLESDPKVFFVKVARARSYYFVSSGEFALPDMTITVADDLDPKDLPGVPFHLTKKIYIFIGVGVGCILVLTAIYCYCHKTKHKIFRKYNPLHEYDRESDYAPVYNVDTDSA